MLITIIIFHLWNRKEVILWKIFSKILFPESEESSEIKTVDQKRDD